MEGIDKIGAKGIIIGATKRRRGEEVYVRRRLLPFDVWVCLGLSLLMAWGAGAVAQRIANTRYQVHVQAHAPVAGEVGGAAGPEVVRVRSVEELLRCEEFTVVSPGIEYRNRGGGYYKGRYCYAVTLPSGERVAAWVNGDSVQEEGGSDYYSSDKILPVGRVVYEDLEADPAFLGQIEFKEPLSRHDFYIDMVGQTAVASQEQVLDVSKMMTQIVTVAVCFPLFHAGGAKLGLWGYYFPPKKKQESMWE